MTGGDPADGRLLLLGRDHPGHGTYVLRTLASGAVACTLSAGADPHSPSRRYKGDPAVPNEDALLAHAGGRRLLLAVADAHFGATASHVLLERLGRTAGREPPATPDDLAALVEGLADGPASGPGRSATTLLVAVHDRRSGRGFGLSFGDSLAALVGPGRTGGPLNRANGLFVAPDAPPSLDRSRAERFAFDTRPGDLLLLFTDGVNECHYREPETSVRPRHLQELCMRSGMGAGEYAARLTELALAGVDGNPGGQDNVALIVAEAGGRDQVEVRSSL